MRVVLGANKRQNVPIDCPAVGPIDQRAVDFLGSDLGTAPIALYSPPFGGWV